MANPGLQPRAENFLGHTLKRKQKNETMKGKIEKKKGKTRRKILEKN